MGQTDLPQIRINPDGQVTAGPFTLQPSRRDYRKHRCHWRALSADGKALTGWTFSPRLALLAALRRQSAAGLGD
jgi:hypothetical protein